MSSKQLLRAAIVSALAATSALAGQAPSFDDCLKNLRSGPGSFIEYTCLGTPGLPERAAEVRAALDQVLKGRPREPHARLYLALMKWYQQEAVPVAEFTEPLAFFERSHADVDAFFANLALIERACLREHVSLRADCKGAGQALERAEQISKSIGDPALERLALIARIRWTRQLRTFSESFEAETRLDGLKGVVPEWLQLLEVSTRVGGAMDRGDDFRVRKLYSDLFDRSAPGTVAHTAALAGVAGATARLASQGLAEKGEAERLLRSAMAAQEAAQLAGYNSAEVGSEVTRSLLALLVGRTPETVGLIGRPTTPSALSIELWLQGSSEDRQRALAFARSLTQAEHPPFFQMAARAHAELVAGSDAEGLVWAERAIERVDGFRAREGDADVQMKADATWAAAYHTLVSDLLERNSSDAAHLALAFRVTEQLRARVLLNTLVSRESSSNTHFGGSRGVDDVQSALRGNEALVSFFLWAPRPTPWCPYTRGHSYALVLTKSALVAVRLENEGSLEPAVKAWTRLVSERGSGTEPGARRLYTAVLKPVLEVLPPQVDSLTLVPDGPLHRLPFDALSETGGPPYLADRYAITVVPSASVWFELRKRNLPPSGLAIAFANTPDGPAVPVAETRGEVVPGQLAALLHAREEAQEAVDAFPPGSRVFAGPEATPARLVSGELSHASLVHFAAHGVADALEPNASFLLLAPTAGASGVLKVGDVPRFDWTGKTIVLSACDTSVGAVRLGEGVLSLARGFFAGGASAVIGTLSRVRDDDQWALFHAFYGELRRGVSVSEAMTAAKRSLIRSGAPPAAWANVIVMGDGSVHPRAPDPPGRSWPVLAALVLGAVLVGVVGVRARRRHTRSG